MIKIESDNYWRFHSVILRRIPNGNERKSFVAEIHEKLLNRGLEEYIMR
jgi:hypothetical protein